MSEAGFDSIEHGWGMSDATIATLKKNGTYVVPTLYVWEYSLENIAKFPDYAQQKFRDLIALSEPVERKLFDAKLNIAFGTDAGVIPHGSNAKEFPIYVKMGMTPLEAIQAATIRAADLLGWPGQVGTLEVGAWADMIGVDGDPTLDVTVLQNVKFVMKGGEIYKNEY